MVMVPLQHRLRMFAGPNGSGKSTITNILPPTLLGIYVNPDEIEKSLNSQGLSFAQFGMQPTKTDIISFFNESALMKRAGIITTAADFNVENNCLYFEGVHFSAYYASVLSDFIRQSLVSQHLSFSFETVMSSFDKVSFLVKAKNNGYKNYLYFVCTEDPEINISRVRYRVLQGGHDVPVVKIVERYSKSLSLLPDAIRHTDRAYLFDNSGAEGARFLAEITDGKDLMLKTNRLPSWFLQHVANRI